MQVRMIVAEVILIGIVVCPGFGQALAEGAMLHANSAVAGAKTGSALGKAVSSATQADGGRLQTVMHPSVPDSKVRNTSHWATESHRSVESAGAFTIVSIQGAPQTCPVVLTATSNEANITASSASGLTASESSVAKSSGLSTGAVLTMNSAASPHCATAPQTQTESKSVVHISFH